MKTIKLLAASGLMTIVMLAIIVLVSYVMNKTVGTDCTLTSITFCMALGCMWSYFYKEFEKEH